MNLHHGDCVEVMAGLPAASVDAIVTDPPYDLVMGRSLQLTKNGDGTDRTHQPNYQQRGFMGKEWDGTGVAFRVETWAAALRLAKPGAYLLAFGGTRTYHRMTVAIEDAGWIIRDCLVWAYASGFPKSKALLKPAWEPIVMARKPGPLRELAIDACRIPGAADPAKWSGRQLAGSRTFTGIGGNGKQSEQSPLGRWPSNVLLTDNLFDGDTPGVVGGGESQSGARAATDGRSDRKNWRMPRPGNDADRGSYSRFFLIPKADRAEREPLLPSGLPLAERRTMNGGLTGVSGDRSGRGGRRESLEMGAATRRNTHPTVKPLDLMRHLVRLVTPASGTVLDPFLGSGTTAIAAEMEGFDWIGIEREAEYIAIAEARLAGVQQGLGLGA